jgi:hypothetical protein
MAMKLAGQIFSANLKLSPGFVNALAGCAGCSGIRPHSSTLAAEPPLTRPLPAQPRAVSAPTKGILLGGPEHFGPEMIS